MITRYNQMVLPVQVGKHERWTAAAFSLYAVNSDLFETKDLA
jgi:hypothetical protein